MPRVTWPELGVVLVASALLVASLAALTDLMPRPDLYDGKAYLRMAQHDFYGYAERGVAAPFAYRPAVPWLVHQLSGSLAISVPTAFRVLAALAAVLNLCLVYGLSRAVGAPRNFAGLVLLLVALSHFAVRGPLYFYTLIDVETYTLLLVASWLLWAHRWFLALAVSWVGLFFKEWLLVPAGVAWIQMARVSIHSKSFGENAWTILAAAVTAVLFLGPRQWLPVSENFSATGRIQGLDSFLAVGLSPGRWANVLYSAASFWLPTLMFLTAERIRGLGSGLQGHFLWMSLYGVGVLGLTLFGGTNIMIFVTYSLPLQVIILSKLLKRSIPVAEIVLVVLAIVVFNKVFVPIPELDATLAGRDRWVDFYGGWGDRVNEVTALRAGLMVLFVGLANGLRVFLRRREMA